MDEKLKRGLLAWAPAGVGMGFELGTSHSPFCPKSDIFLSECYPGIAAAPWQPSLKQQADGVVSRALGIGQ